MLSRDEVLRIAELAKIQIDETDIERYQKDLSAILDFVGKLSSLPVREQKDHTQMMGLESIYRNDEERSLPFEKGSGLINQSPESKKGFVLSPHILKKGK